MNSRTARGATPATGLTQRQRWMAAQRLAVGDEPELAAVYADVPDEEMPTRPDSGDRHFPGLLAACRRVDALSIDDRCERVAGMAYDTLERSLADGQATILVHTLKSLEMLRLPGPIARDDHDPDDGDGGPRPGGKRTTDGPAGRSDGTAAHRAERLPAQARPTLTIVSSTPEPAPADPVVDVAPPAEPSRPPAPPKLLAPKPAVPIRRAKEPIPSWHLKPLPTDRR